MGFPLVRPALTAVTSAFFLCSTVPSLAQSSATAPDSAISPATTAQPITKAEQKKQAKAQRKAERKAAHAKNTAELKKLEDSGYHPGRNDPNYPEDLQAAQKKANAPAGASQ